jgi:hypothetical protein
MGKSLAERLAAHIKKYEWAGPVCISCGKRFPEHRDECERDALLKEAGM